MKAYNRSCEECGKGHQYCREDDDGLMVCGECHLKGLQLHANYQRHVKEGTLHHAAIARKIINYRAQG